MKDLFLQGAKAGTERNPKEGERVQAREKEQKRPAPVSRERLERAKVYGTAYAIAHNVPSSTLNSN
jgi:hypothetical protein